MKWLIVALILVYVGFRITIAIRPESAIARAFKRRYLLRTDAHAMTRKQLLLSSLSFLAFGVALVGLSFGVGWGSSALDWRVFDSRPVVVLGNAGLFVGGMALITSVFLLGAAVLRRG